MLNFKRSVNIKAAATALLIIVAYVFVAAQTNESETPIALVKKIVKNVTHQVDSDSDWEIAKTGMPLADGEKVKTGFRSLALVLFTDGSGLLRVRENSILNIHGNQIGQNLNKNTEIKKGFVGFEINKQEAEEFKFTTPTAVAAIRGTEGFIEVTEKNLAIIACSEGKIEVESLIGIKSKIFVEAGFFAIQQPNGYFKLEQLDGSVLDQLNQTRNSSLEKISIETKEGIIEVEYYTDDE